MTLAFEQKWVNGDIARFTYSSDKFTFEDNRIIFPENDFKMEYRGEVVNEHVMHGTGTLTLKNGAAYEGEWVAGTCVA